MNHSEKARLQQQVQEEIDTIKEDLNLLRKVSGEGKNLRIQELEIRITQLGTILYNLQKVEDKKIN
jgi:hypothetical protein